MQTTHWLLKPAMNIAIGLVLGLVTANYFAATGDPDEVTTLSPSASSVDNSKAADAQALPTIPSAPEKTAAATLKPASQESIASNTHNGDISLLEAIEIREEPNTTETPPEELIKYQPMELAATPRFDSQETRDMEERLRWESQNSAPIQSVGNEGLLEHERR